MPFAFCHCLPGRPSIWLAAAAAAVTLRLASGLGVPWRCRSHERVLPHFSSLRHDAPGGVMAAHGAGSAGRNATASSASAGSRYSWNEWVLQLHEYRQQYGDTHVPKRYPGLGAWVNRQRQLYQKRLRGEASSLTVAQIDVLNRLQFCWDASNLTMPRPWVDRREPENTDHGEDNWWANFHRLEEQLERSGQRRIALLRLSAPMSRWIKRQRQELRRKDLQDEGALRCLQALRQLDPQWMLTRRDLQWEVRFRELLRYKQTYGHYNVPITFENKQLAHWVSNQRKQYNLRQRKEPSLLTEQRLRRLQAIGFVFNRWEDEFAKQVESW